MPRKTAPIAPQSDASPKAITEKAPQQITLPTPDWWSEACTHLMEKDAVMRVLIPRFPEVLLTSRGDPFTTLMRSIVGQQISVRAAQAVWDRLAAALEQNILPKAVLALSIPAMRACGLSARKAEYVQDLARHFVEYRWDVADWAILGDEAVIEQLCAVRGIGRWTAEMFLIFYLLRPDVLPLDDIGLVNGISKLYFSGEKVGAGKIRALAKNWHPWSSVATWYIWRSLDPLPVAY